jgi:hypothetical protein
MEDSSHELIDQMMAEERYCYGFEIMPGNTPSSEESRNNQEITTSSSQVYPSSFGTKDQADTTKVLTEGSSLSLSGQNNVTETSKVPMSK